VLIPTRGHLRIAYLHQTSHYFHRVKRRDVRVKPSLYSQGEVFESGQLQLGVSEGLLEGNQLLLLGVLNINLRCLYYVSIPTYMPF